MAVELLEEKVKSKFFPVLIIVQLFITVFALSVVNEIAVDVWRSLRGH
jgi:ABC-type uncharacterized transport system permease subunit